ncbi:MAG TPA: hypothetical protein VL635_05590 [Trinickia sp.]|nr:hypothetical protein [Trinickia sp.]
MIFRVTDASSSAAANPAATPQLPAPSPVNHADATMARSIGDKPIDASTMSAAVRAAWQCRDDDGLIVGQAAVTLQMQSDMASGAQAGSQGGDAVQRAVAELKADHLPDLDDASFAKIEEAMSTRAGAMTAGGLGAGGPGTAPTARAPSAASIKNAATQLNAYLRSGATLSEALACLSTQYGGEDFDPTTLACAALATQAPAMMPTYLRDPTGPSPVQLGAAALNSFFDADTLASATKLMAATPNAKAIDVGALGAAAHTLAGDVEGTTQYENDMRALRAALLDALNAASGEHGSTWIGDPAHVDAWLQAEAAVTKQVLTSADGATRQRTAHDLGLALIELQALSAVENAAPAGPAGDTAASKKTQTDVAQTTELTAQLGNLGLLTMDPATLKMTPPSNPYGLTPNAGATNVDAWTLYSDITSDPAIARLKFDDLSDVLSAAGSAAPESAGQAQADLRATSGILAEFKQAGAWNYQALLAATTRSAPVQQRFADLAASVHERHAVDEVHADAQILKGVGAPADADLTRALYEQKFKARFEGLVAHGKWNTASGLSVLWEHNDAPRYAMDVGDAYAALGDAGTPAGATEAGRSLLDVVKARMDGDHFVGVSNGDEKVYDLNWTDKSGNHAVNPQLFQDIVASDPNSRTSKFIKEELPSASGNGSSRAARSATDDNGASANASAPSTTQIITSRTALIDALGQAYGKTPVSHAAPGEPQYDGDDEAYGHTTLNALADAVVAAQDGRAPSAASPIEVTMLPMLYWREGATPKRAEEDDAQRLALLQVDGTAGRKYVGPANARVFDSYEDWTRDTGLEKGVALSQQHPVTDAAGTPVGLWDRTITGPRQHVGNMQILLKAGEAMLAYGSIGVTSFVSPEADGLLGLLYDGSQAYYAYTAAAQTAHATEAIAADPTSWRTWTSGAMAVASSALQGKTLAGRFKLNVTPSIVDAAAQGDPVVAEMMSRVSGKRVVVFGGYSGLGYADAQAVARACAQDLEREIEAHGAQNIIVVGGATSDGIGDIGYAVAKGYAVDTLGIVSEEARAFGASPYCDYVIYVPDPGQTWSTVAPNGLSYMVTVADEGRGVYYAYGGGDIARDELMEAQRRGVPIVVHPEFEPDPAKVAARLAKNPDFEAQPVPAAIRSGRLKPN